MKNISEFLKSDKSEDGKVSMTKGVRALPFLYFPSGQRNG
jgi:hypothetical protein